MNRLTNRTTLNLATIPVHLFQASSQVQAPKWTWAKNLIRLHLIGLRISGHCFRPPPRIYSNSALVVDN